MTEEITHYIRDIQKLLGLKYQEVINSMQVLEPEWEPKGGINTRISDVRFRQLCAKHNVHIRKSTETEIVGTIHKTTGNDSIIIVPDDPVINSVKSTYNNDTLREYNELAADDLNPLKVKAQITQVNTDESIAFERLTKIKNKYKTILKHTDIHDSAYLQGLFQPYQFLIVPGNISRNQRQKLGLNGFFLHVYVTGQFNNKMIAFNRSEALYAFIINV